MVISNIAMKNSARRSSLTVRKFAFPFGFLIENQQITTPKEVTLCPILTRRSLSLSVFLFLIVFEQICTISRGETYRHTPNTHNVHI
eukprot:TRINITY_DN1824_c0_g1_i1.p2 TRINITY_DN1824_c0_g1~~TRINITY_DN1824_c0_g1_i1.p2  ORF type:complete len:87 (+),score=8.60 TRINITY_DN1824_c0_g1_i1:659-919(+)